MADENVLTPISNPLFLDVIVDKLFEYLPREEIINQRRVCRLWQRIGLKKLKKNIDAFTISFHLDKPIEKFFEMADGFSFKFTSFAIRYWNDDANTKILNDQQTTRLFEEYGSHMKKITLKLCGSTNTWAFLSDVLVNKAPNVEQLCLESYPQKSKATGLFSGKQKLKLKHLSLLWEDEATELMYFQTFLADLFASSPYLESLVISYEWEDETRLTNYALQILADHGNISSLRRLCFNEASNDVFSILATSFKCAELEYFWIETYHINLATLPYIETFLGDHKDTLKNLYIIFPCVEYLNKIQLPKMNNLKILSLHGWWCDDESGLHEHRVPLGVFDFGKLFPNLLTLSLFENPISKKFRFFNMRDLFPKQTTPVLTLKNLDLLPISSPAILRRIGRIFPNVLKLYIAPQTPDVLRELWTTWPEMKTLHISIIPYPSFRYINLDSVFTGVAASDYSRNCTSIRQLKRIRHLAIDRGSRISVRADVKDIKIKDETARLAFAEMKELVSLRISKNRHQISPSCAQQLCEELNLLKIENEKKNGALHLVKYEWQKRSVCSTVIDYE